MPHLDVRDWQRYYRMCRDAGLPQERAESYADRMYHEALNGGDFGLVVTAMREEAAACEEEQ